MLQSQNSVINRGSSPLMAFQDGQCKNPGRLLILFFLFFLHLGKFFSNYSPLSLSLCMGSGLLIDISYWPCGWSILWKPHITTEGIFSYSLGIFLFTRFIHLYLIFTPYAPSPSTSVKQSLFSHLILLRQFVWFHGLEIKIKMDILEKIFRDKEERLCNWVSIFNVMFLKA